MATVGHTNASAHTRSVHASTAQAPVRGGEIGAVDFAALLTGEPAESDSIQARAAPSGTAQGEVESARPPLRHENPSVAVDESGQQPPGHVAPEAIASAETALPESSVAASVSSEVGEVAVDAEVDPGSRDPVLVGPMVSVDASPAKPSRAAQQQPDVTDGSSVVMFAPPGSEVVAITEPPSADRPSAAVAPGDNARGLAVGSLIPGASPALDRIAGATANGGNPIAPQNGDPPTVGLVPTASTAAGASDALRSSEAPEPLLEMMESVAPGTAAAGEIDGASFDLSEWLQNESRAFGIDVARFRASEDGTGPVTPFDAPDLAGVMGATGATRASPTSGLPGSGTNAMPSVDTASADWAQDVGAELLHIREAGDTRLRLNLAPGHLGGVQFDLMQTDQGIELRVVTESTAARDLLQQNSESLRERMEQAGLQLAGFHCETGTRGQGEAAFDGYRNGVAAQESGDENPSAVRMTPMASPRLLDLYA